MQMKKEQQNVQNYTERLCEGIHVREKARIIMAMNISLTA